MDQMTKINRTNLLALARVTLATQENTSKLIKRQYGLDREAVSQEPSKSA
jgi:hypothetical protein